MAYANGRIPLDQLVLLNWGHNEDGYWEHRLPEGTLQRWENLVADVLENEGIALTITPGWNAYRPFEAQEAAKKAACDRGRCQDAATPGQSSHGGVFQGRDAMAIDVGNYSLIGKAKFYEYARKHGFTVNVFDWEPWHIIDFDPYTVPNPYKDSTSNEIGLEMPIRIIDSPSYRAAKQRVIHNGSSAMTIPDGWVQNMIQVGRVSYGHYTSDDDLVAEVSLVWQLGGMDADTAAKRTAEMLSSVKK